MILSDWVKSNTKLKCNFDDAAEEYNIMVQI